MDISTSADVIANITLPFPAGTIIPYAGNFAGIAALAAQGWLLCDGLTMQINDYPQLYAAIGTAFGGDGTTTFNMPDLRGQFLRGVDMGAGVDPDANARTAQANGGNSGPNVGSQQAECLQNHQHNWSHNFGNITHSGNDIQVQLAGDGGNMGTLPTTDNDGGGNETRPVNVYVYYLIFAGLIPFSTRKYAITAE